MTRVEAAHAVDSLRRGFRFDRPQVLLSWSASTAEIGRLFGLSWEPSSDFEHRDVQALGHVAFLWVRIHSDATGVSRIEMSTGEANGRAPIAETRLGQALRHVYGHTVTEDRGYQEDFALGRISRRVVEGFVIDHGYYEEGSGRMGEEWAEEQVIIRRPAL